MSGELAQRQPGIHGVGQVKAAVLEAKLGEPEVGHRVRGHALVFRHQKAIDFGKGACTIDEALRLEIPSKFQKGYARARLAPSTPRSRTPVRAGPSKRNYKDGTCTCDADKLILHRPKSDENRAVAYQLGS